MISAFTAAAALQIEDQEQLLKDLEDKFFDKGGKLLQITKIEDDRR